LGELIMNSVSISNFQALANIMTSITGRPKCLDEIAQTAPRSFGSETRKPFITNPDDTWSRLSKVFELRHILCHELAADLKIDESETRLLLLAAQEFVRASAAWLESLEAPNIRRRMQERSRTQSAHRARAERQTANLLERTNQLLTTFPLKDGKEIKKAVNEAESYLRSYLSSLKTIGAYGATEMGKMRNQSRVQSIDPESHANLLEPLIDALTKMEFNLQLRAEFER
jgi:hypothetical protein